MTTFCILTMRQYACLGCVVLPCREFERSDGRLSARGAGMGASWSDVTQVITEALGPCLFLSDPRPLSSVCPAEIQVREKLEETVAQGKKAPGCRLNLFCTWFVT